MYLFQESQEFHELNWLLCSQFIFSKIVLGIFKNIQEKSNNIPLSYLKVAEPSR